MEITSPQDCDNSPKRRLVKELNIAFAEANIPALEELFHPNIEWVMVGDRKIKGLEEILKFLETIKVQKAIALNLEQILTHGKYASAVGSLTFKENKIAFHDHYEFTSAGSSKLKKIISFAIPIKETKNIF